MEYEIIYDTDGNPSIKQGSKFIPVDISNRDFRAFLVWNYQQATPLDYTSKQPINLDAYKADKVASLNAQAIALVESRYPTTVQAAFAGILAASSTMPNRAAYCQQLLSWGASVISAYAQAAAQVNAATTQADIDNITLDEAGLLASNPNVSLPEALAILD